MIGNATPNSPKLSAIVLCIPVINVPALRFWLFTVRHTSNNSVIGGRRDKRAMWIHEKAGWQELHTFEYNSTKYVCVKNDVRIFNTYPCHLLRESCYWLVVVVVVVEHL